MEPVLKKGSIIYIQRKKYYKNGDIIAFINGKDIISHRIIGEKELSGQSYFSTKGDANRMSDWDLVSLNNINGKVISAVPYVGEIVIFYKTPQGNIFGILFPIVVYLAISFYQKKKAHSFFA